MRGAAARLITLAGLAAGAAWGQITVTCAPTALPQLIGTAVSVTCGATGGTGIYAWSISSGSLPPGLSINILTGSITGTLIDPAGPYSFTVMAADLVNLPGTQSYSGTTADPLTVSCLPTTGPVEVGVPYSTTCTAAGGTQPYNWSVGGSAVPPGMAVTPAGTQATISLVPTGPMTSYQFYVAVVDSSVPALTQSSALFTGSIAPQVVITTASPLPAATFNTFYSVTFGATGGIPGYVWAASGLPSWLTMSASGVLTGTPPSTGPVNFTATVTDMAGGVGIGSFTLPVNGPLNITTTSPLPAAIVGTFYTQTFAATGGTGTGYTWSATGLPSWLVMSAGGVLSGTPTSTSVNSTFTVNVKDSANNQAPGTFTLPVTLTITTTSPLPTATIGAPYSQTFVAGGGAGGYTWVATGLPSWLALSAAGVLTAAATPTSAVNASFTVKVTDSASVSTSNSFSLPVTLAIITTSPLPAATINTAYNQNLVAGGGAGGYTWLATGLPSWLTLSPAGALTGTPPTSAVSATFTAKVTDSASVAATGTFTVPVTLKIITVSPLPAATVNTAYSQTFAAQGGAGGYTWSATGLPAWLTLSPAGALTGTPPTPAAVNLTVTVKDSGGGTSSGPFMLPVNAIPLAITTNSPLSSGTIGVPYSQTLTGTGGVPPYTWSVTSGSLPTSLGLNGGSGVISGTPTAAGTFTFTIQLNDSASTPPVTKQFTITIASGLTITTAPSLPNATIGVTYSQTLQAVGGTPPYTWSITQGALPAPLTLNPSTAAISGVPAAAGTANFTVQVSDGLGVTSTKAFTLTVVGAVSITTASLPGGTVGVAYSQTIAASGGAPPYSWSITAGATPAGTGLNPSTGTLSGIPTSSASFTFTVQVSDSSSNTASKAFTVVIASVVTITTAPALPSGNAGTAYSQTLTASGGTAPYSWAITGGSLPSGLTLSTGGVISGTPSAAVNASFTIQATDSAGGKASKAFTLAITSALTISTISPLATAEIGVAYSQTLAATGGGPPYTWSVSSSALPTGLTLTAGGMISGTPSSAGTFTFTARVTDSNSASATKTFVLTVAVRVSITTPPALNGGSVGVSYSQTLAATGGLFPYTWSLVSGALPGGLALSSGGVISGSPTAPGTFVFTAGVTDQGGVTASQQFTIVVATGLIISSASALPGAIVGTAYSDMLRAAGGTTPYTWTRTAGSLPAGLSLATTGAISGTPIAVGTSSFTVEVSDSAGHQTSKQLSMAVELRPTISTSSLPGGTAGVAYSQTLGATGGTPPYSWSITAGALPAGLALSTAGAITGAPTAAGTFTFTVQLSDSLSVTDSKQLSITVTATVSISTATPLPAGSLGASYSETLTAAGGKAPYTWTLTAGSLPAGLALASAGTIGGTPTTAGTATFTLQVEDSTGATASQQFTLTTAAGLKITTAAALPGGTAGTAYSQTLAAAGGTSPYQWSITTGALPAGLTLNSASGNISGTPAAAGNFSVTVQVTDATHASTSQAFTLVVALLQAPSADFTGFDATASSLQQLTGGLSLTAKYPVDITGQVTLAFQPDAVNAADDPSIQFSTGGRSMTFTIPHGTTTPASFSLQTGSVAGTITLSVTWQAGGVRLPTPTELSQSIQIARAAPVITAVTASTTSSGFQVLVTGYSNTREATQAVVQFTPAAGQSLQTSTATVPLTDAANTWFQGASSDQYGSQFILTLPFTVTGGSAGSVGSVSVTLTNSVGTSHAMSGSL